jgi:hypothetical protein
VRRRIASDVKIRLAVDALLDWAETQVFWRQMVRERVLRGELIYIDVEAMR